MNIGIGIMKVLIDVVDNGFIITNIVDEEKTVVVIEEGTKDYSEILAFRELCSTLEDALVTQSRYEKYKITYKIEPGDKYEGEKYTKEENEILNG